MGGRDQRPDPARRPASEIHRDKMACLGELTVGIAHELNNTVGYIASNLNTLGRYTDGLRRLVDRVEGHLNPDAADRWHSELAEARWQQIDRDLAQLLEETREGADHLKRVVADLKALARPTLTSESVSLDQCVEGGMTILTHALKHRYQVELNLVAPRLLHVIRPQVMQVAINLIHNALQAQPNGGRLRISTVDDGEHATLLVDDAGPGVPTALVRKIFEPYFTTKQSGTGLGLAIAAQVVRSHGGDLSVSPSDLGGARFAASFSGLRHPRAETMQLYDPAESSS